MTIDEAIACANGHGMTGDLEQAQTYLDLAERMIETRLDMLYEVKERIEQRRK